MVGDSITKRGQAWRTYMAELRPEWVYVGSRFDGVYWHDGVGGDTTWDVLARLWEVPTCDVAILDIGGNDIAQNVTGYGQLVRNIEDIAGYLAARGAQVHILNLIPCDCGPDGNLKIGYANWKIKQIAGYPVIDVWNAMVTSGIPKELLYVDSFHPSALGYQIMATHVAPLVLP